MDMDRYNRIVDLEDAARQAGYRMLAFYCKGAAHSLLQGYSRLSNSYLEEATVVAKAEILAADRQMRKRKAMIATKRGY